MRFFGPATPAISLRKEQIVQTFLTFRCRNCEESTKTFALWLSLGGDGENGRVFKLGEVPPFGPPTPTRLLSIICPDKDYFLKGRRAENQGLGIRAFAYYRRVIENQKTRVLDETIKVSEKLSASNEVLADLRVARQEAQFSKAVAAVKHGIPQILLINGHNPLTLLHAALSEGLHAQTDEQCLELATSIRAVTSELAENLAKALKEEAELNAAVTRLLKGAAARMSSGALRRTAQKKRRR